ncbi:MAG: multicopper oxidase domain-containing protein [Candidatus Omnitrophica bacterium]|nr:multicopper oxidase domain-containing protein [Candidatus Omnitrophota bacterium]
MLNQRLNIFKKAAAAAMICGITAGYGQTGPNPFVDYTVPNWAISPNLTKFVDALPGFEPGATNEIGQYMPVAIPDTNSYPGADYYEIAVVDYTEQMHSELPPTRLRGYVQLETAITKGNHYALTYPDGSPILDAVSNQVYAVEKPHYAGPLITAQMDRPTRIKFYNLLPLNANGGHLFIPVDTTYMGAGTGPLGVGNGTPESPELYTENRAVIHLHGGYTPWISDGTPHQWITPAGEHTSYPEGVSTQNVPDMPVPPFGAVTLYYPNQQSGRLMFYHDHAYGITRLNVYAGMVAGYLITDPVEQGLVDSGVIPSNQVPLIIQDKSYVPDLATLAVTDPLWDTNQWGGTGNLWFPHVYIPNQDTNSPDGMNPFGRWDYGPWFWPIFPVTQPYPPIVSGTPEAFMDTPVVNGTAFPYLNVEPKAYRFRILNGCNDRMLNLQLYQADPTNYAIGGVYGTEVRMIPAVPGTNIPLWYPTMDIRDGGIPDPALEGPRMIQIGNEGGLLPAAVILTNRPVGYEYNRRNIVVLNVKEKTLFLGPAERADVVIDFSGFAGKTVILYNDAPAPVPGFDPRNDYYTGDPDLTATGGAPTTQPGKGPNTRTVMQFRVVPTLATGSGSAPLTNIVVTAGGYGYSASPMVTITGGGGIATAEAAVSGGTITAINITSQSAPFTNAPVVAITDPTGVGALAVANLVSAPAFDPAALIAQLPAAYTAIQPPPLIPEMAYGASTNHYGKIFDYSMTFTNTGATNPTTITFQSKAIQELFDPDYGRMNATLGVELPFTTSVIQTTIPYGYSDPPTEIVPMGATQIWRVTHNGVDTHPVHFHLFDVQLINRVGWDGAITPPDPNELGWKETVRMNPLEDVFVALRPTVPLLPFPVPESIRPLKPESPIGSTNGFMNVDPYNNPITVTNEVLNFGWEYIWHCHMLGHEENDFMRAIIITGVTGYVVENIAPTVTAQVSPLPNGAGWNNTNAMVTLTAVDNPLGAGVASITYGASGANPIAPTTVPGSTVSLVISNEGTTSISFFATDQAYMPNSSAPQSVTVNLDMVSPTLAWGTPTPPANGSGWNNSTVTIPWTASDALSGVASPGATGSISFTAAGSNQTQVVTVTDNAGNSSAFTSPSVNLDPTSPTVIVRTRPSSVLRNNSRGARAYVTIYGSVTDALSGVDTSPGAGSFTIVDSAGSTIPSGTFTVSSNGTYSVRISLSIGNTSPSPRVYTITAKAKDKAGNTGSAVATFTVR